METLLQGLPGVCLYFDDILVTSENDQTVLQKLASAGVQLKAIMEAPAPRNVSQLTSFLGHN